MSRILLLLILIAGPLLPLRGEVFMLWPWKGGGTASGESLAGQLPGIGRMLHAEKMRVNGVDLQLKISAVNADFPLLLSWLAKMFRPENLQSAGGSVKVAYKVGRQVERSDQINFRRIEFCLTVDNDQRHAETIRPVLEISGLRADRRGGAELNPVESFQIVLRQYFEPETAPGQFPCERHQDHFDTALNGVDRLIRRDDDHVALFRGEPRMIGMFL